MNTKNNKRRRESQTKIEKTFADMILTRNISEISVTDICKATGLNRTTFYANYADIFDLADKIRANIENVFGRALAEKENQNALTMFGFIYEHQNMFKVYFKLIHDKNVEEYVHDFELARRHFEDDRYLKYHVEFFKNGLNAIIKMWLDGGCRETPEEMAEIVKSEYRGR